MDEDNRHGAAVAGEVFGDAECELETVEQACIYVSHLKLHPTAPLEAKNSPLATQCHCIVKK